MPNQEKSPPKYPRLSPTTDIVFKILFSQNEDILIALLSAVLQPQSPITEATVLNPELPKGKIDDKGTIMDIRVRFADGTLVGVEMQSSRRAGASARWLYYWAKNYAGQIKRGDEHEQLRKVIGVFFFDYTLEDGQFHGVYDVRERETGRRFSDLLELHTIEMPRLGAGVLRRLESNPDMLQRWSRFLTSKNPHELAALKESDPMIQKAEERLEELSADPAARKLAEERQFGLDLWAIEKSQEVAEGRAEGRAEGQRESLQQSIRWACESFEVELTAEREAVLEANGTDLDALMKSILKERCWPE